MFGRDMTHVARAWITEKRPALAPRLQLLRLKSPLAPARHAATDLQTPVGIQMVPDPVITLPPWPALLRLLEVGHKVGRFSGGTAGPGRPARGHGQRVAQHPRAVADVLVCTSLASAGLGRGGWCFALKHLPAGLCIAADHHAALVIYCQRVAVELAHLVGFRRKVRIVAVEPVRTLVGLQIDVLQEAPDARAAARIGVEVVQQGLDDCL